MISPVYNLSRGRRLSGITGGGKNCEELSQLENRNCYVSPEHRQQQAQARRAAAARVAAQREDSSDLAPEHPTRITPRNRSSTGTSRSDLIPGRMSLGTAPRTSTGSGDHLARFETGDY